MNKILKPYTIIPPELYIERDADRQVDNIIRDMGRPGYVLVSRQMGKTNLLLNAKRRLENEDIIFGYIDLSNPFENVKSCFEFIVDTIIETNEDILLDVQDTIKNNRKQQVDIPPFKQHTNELRLILKHFKGKLIIILDEIDALTKKKYSDQIFAQIRSVYFSRANYKELENLTYILSGVVEPNEIIKDPKISPFNIGEKIFLNDFSINEFKQFVVKSKLQLSQTNTDRIFFWTSGNPRITWDVCAEIENKFSDKEISQNDIDLLISEMYLTAFDRPPIDNIRELVKNDRELRNAIIEIAYKKGNEVSDKIKSKLYLSGITNFNGNNDVHIKNEIIKRSLSLDWIKQIEEEDKGLIVLANEFYGKENYSDSLFYFEKYLENNKFDSNIESLYYYYMGSAAYHLSNFKKSLDYLNFTNFKKGSAEEPFYYWTLNLKGLVSFYNGNIADSLAFLRQIIDDKKGNDSYMQALLNYGIFAKNSNIEKYESESMKIFEDIVSEIGFDKDKFTVGFLDEIKSVAYYNIAQTYGKRENVDYAIENYEKSLGISKIEKKPILLLGIYNTTKDISLQKSTLTKIINLIIENDLNPIELDPDKQLIFNENHLKEILTISFLNSYSEFEKLKPWLHFLGEKPFVDYIYDLFLFSMSYKKDWGTGVTLLRKIYELFYNGDSEVNDEIKYDTLRYLIFFNDKKVIKEDYISLFEKNRIRSVDYIDFSIFANFIGELVDQKKYTESLKYIQIINSVGDQVSADLKINYLAIYNLELNAYYYLKKYDMVTEKAKEILDFCNDNEIKKYKSNLLGDKGFEIIRKNAEAILFPQNKVQQPIKAEKKIGPNEWVKVKYLDGRIENKKYKKVKDEINNGICTIISNE